MKLTYERDLKTDVLDCYVGADWAEDAVDRKSTTGYVIRMYGNIIYWKSRKQGGVTKSSTAAEYVALSESVSELKLIKDIPQDFNIKIEKPIHIYKVNAGAISISKYGNFTKNSKYIETHYHFVNENYVNRVIDVRKIDSNDNIADMFTKALGRNKFETLREMLRLI